LDAFSTREVGYNVPSLFVTQAPPEVVDLPTVQHSANYNNKPSRYLSPSLSKAAARGPPVAFHNQQAKRESSQPSIDSFYGGPSPSDYKGYAL